MSSGDSPLLRVAAARTAFLDQGRLNITGVSDLVVASWERSRVAGVDELQPLSSFSDEIDTDSLLARCARPVMEQLADDTADMPLAIGLTDRRVRVVTRMDASSTASRLFDRAQYAPGFDFSEAAVGTNGAGTVFEAGQPVSIVGPAHFSESLHIFGASGAPIIDPVTGRVEGVVAMAALAPAWNPVMHALIKSAAREISRNLLLDRSRSQHALFDAYLRATTRSARLAVFAFSTALMIASPAAQQMFDGGEQQVIRDHATFLLAHRERASDTLVLPESQLLVRIRGTRVFAGEDVAGLLVIAEPATSRRAGSAEPVSLGVRATTPFRPHESLAGGRSPAWVRACDELRNALENKKPVVLIGETGVGKFTMATELFHAVYPSGRSIEVDAEALAAHGTAGPLPNAHGKPTLHIVRDVDQVSTGGLRALKTYFAAVESLDSPGWMVGTVTHDPSVSTSTFDELPGQFDTAITVPPLRYRTDDLAGIAAALLRGIAPERAVQLSPAAHRLISRYSWPGNITQLREALAHALRQRQIGEIAETDLPGYCRTASRRALTQLEVVERDAIVAALHQTKGSRVAAAAHLGMSRSSLYRKLKTYGITT